ncbi:hypothetical protein TNCV_3095691 [Trichonephila clavipes]|nr:hypothetical protein TNCV_3095691 [Trichonephila clavipes]
MKLSTEQATIMDYTQSVSLPSSRSSTPQVSHYEWLQVCNGDFRKYTIMHTEVTQTLSSSSITNSDKQKANLLALTLRNNFIESKRSDDRIYPIDESITYALEDFFSHPPPLPIAPTNPDEITDCVRSLPNKKAPGSDNITNKTASPLQGPNIFRYGMEKRFAFHFPKMSSFQSSLFLSAYLHHVNVAACFLSPARLLEYV